MKVGLRMNTGKTKLVCNPLAGNKPLKTEGTELEFADEVKRFENTQNMGFNATSHTQNKCRRECICLRI